MLPFHRIPLALFVSLQMGCGDSLKSTTSKSKQSFVGCPAGTVSYDGWSGEYPDPILQVNKDIKLKSRDIVCQEKADKDCTVPAGLYHPWSDITSAKFKTVAAVSRYVALKDIPDFGKSVPKGTMVTEHFYAAEGQCGLVVDGQSFQDTCPSSMEAGLFKELPSEAKDFQPQQYFQASCKEGYQAWIHVTEQLQKHPDIQEGEQQDYGNVIPSALPDGSMPFADIWSTRRKSIDTDLKINASSGPFWVISIAAGKDKNSAIKKVNSLRNKGFSAHIAWLGSYGSAKNKPYWLTYIGPYATTERSKVVAELAKVKSQINPKAYAVTLGNAGERKTIK